jgi:uncharacterized protein (DUF1501 family)
MANLMINRRGFLTAACSLAAAPLLTPATFAATPGENRFVTILLRGAMDGLWLVQPYGDANLKRWRPDFALDPSTGLFDLDGYFGFHPEAGALNALYKDGELAIVNAVSTPYRNTRSHFDGQDMLETGGERVNEERSGWLNRALSLIPRTAAARAIDVHSSAELILTGPNRVDVWSASTDLAVSADDIAFLERLYRGDAAFAKAMAETLEADRGADAVFGDDARGDRTGDMARLTAGMLKGDYRIASFSINGWDTHVGQARVFNRPLRSLTESLTILKHDLGPEIWKNTTVLAMTEFGRTVRQNGSKGTDHGTGGLALIAGGAIAGGKVFGKWPGLAESQLLENRDLAPTGDLREIAAHLLSAQFGIAKGDLATKVFPGLDFSIGKPGYLR